jgi:hypothetical protein
MNASALVHANVLQARPFSNFKGSVILLEDGQVAIDVGVLLEGVSIR